MTEEIKTEETPVSGAEGTEEVQSGEVEETPETPVSDIDAVRELLEEITRERDSYKTRLEELEKNSGASEEVQKRSQELQELIARFKGKGGTAPTGVASSSSNSQRTAPLSDQERLKQLIDIDPESLRIDKKK